MTAFHRFHTGKALRKRFYKAFIEPRQLDQSLRNREFVFNVLLVGTGASMLALLMLLLQSYVSGNHQVAGRLPTALAGVAYIGLLRVLSRRLSYYAAAYALVGFYALLAIGSVAAWGISTPFGVLLLGLMIVLASTVLSSRHVLYAGGLAITTVITVQLGNDAGWLASHPPGVPMQSQLGDAVGHSVVYAILAIISWLFGRETERSLSRAEAAESELEKEKANLEVKIAKRTKQLKQVQLEEMRQLYNFAEVGQLSTSLLHDLANHLTVLTIEIEDLRGQRHSEQLNRSQRIIGYLNDMLDVVRNRIAGKSVEQYFDVCELIDSVVDIALLKDQTGKVSVDWQRPQSNRPHELYGDPIKCGQALAIVIGNAIDAYVGQKAKNRHPLVSIRLTTVKSNVVITVVDWGVGISPDNRERIFKPAFTTKASSMGVGLYLAKQMIGTEFSGTIKLIPADDRTEFAITIPVNGHER